MAEQWDRIRRSLFSRAKDTDTAPSERYRRAALSSVTGIGYRAISLFATLLTVRLTLKYLGTERYGMWMTISAFVSMIGSADLGLGAGLVTAVADSYGRGDTKRTQQAISSVMILLGAIAGFALLLLAAAYTIVPWARALNVTSPTAMREAGPAFAVLFVCFAVNLPLGTISSVQQGLQRAFVYNLWGVGASLLSLLGLLVAIHLHAGLPSLLAALVGLPLFALLINGLIVFGREFPDLRPRLSSFSWPVARHLVTSGLLFFCLLISMSIGYGSDNVVIAHVMGVQAVAKYAVASRLFNTVLSLLQVLMQPMWPAYSDAIARRDGAWVQRAYRRVAVWGGLLAITVAVFLCVFGNWIITIWVGPAMRVSLALSIVFAIRCVLSAYLQPINYLLNGLGRMRIQAVTSLSMAALNICLSIYFVKHLGIIGAVLGTVLAEALVMVLPLTVAAHRSLRKLQEAHAW